MGKEAFYNSLNIEQKEYLDKLLDLYYCNGYTEGRSDGKIEQMYEDRYSYL